MSSKSQAASAYSKVNFDKRLDPFDLKTRPMGLDSNGTRFLLYAKSLGADFARTATIGRQGLHLSEARLAANLRRFGYPDDPVAVRSILQGSAGFADTFLRMLGAEDVHSFDYSGYEEATHIHDMNSPIGREHWERYSVVVDGGSLEHVFNVPVALANCMNMVRAGGHFLAITPTNNFMGHGFYQFSPELFFSIFTKENGYRLVSVVVLEAKAETIWYRVTSPAVLKRRVTLTNTRPTYLMVLAQRVECTSVLTRPPLQSDYVSTWAGDPDKRLVSTPSGEGRVSTVAVIRGLVPESWKSWFRARLKAASERRHKKLTPFNPDFFQRIPDSEISGESSSRATTP